MNSQRYSIDCQGPNYDPYPNNFKCWVTISDLKTGKELKRRGYGMFIGNFSPIWITIKNKEYQLTEIERLQEDLF